MASHRYWRIYIYSNGSNQFPCLSEVTMAASSGGTNLIGTGTATASTTFDAPHAASMAVDGNTATYWNGTSGGTPGWWQYDFGSGNAFDIKEVKITCRTDDPTRSPGVWGLESSDDSSTWTSVGEFKSATWTAGAQQTFLIASGPQQWDANYSSPLITLSGSNLIATFNVTSGWASQPGNVILTGTSYFEVTVTTAGPCMIGLASVAMNTADWLGDTSNGGISWQNNGESWPGGGFTLATFTSGDTICVATNVPLKKTWFRKNGGLWVGGTSPNPASGIGGFDITSVIGTHGCVFPGISGGGTPVLQLNAGGSAFSFSNPFASSTFSPSGFFLG